MTTVLDLGAETDLAIDLESLLDDFPRCAARRHIMRKQRVPCSEEATATVRPACNGRSVLICQNLVEAIAGCIADGRICLRCKKTLAECWAVTPL